MTNTKQQIVRSFQAFLVAMFLGAVTFTCAAQTIIDNTDPGFSATGTWPPSTVVPGFFGPNYQFHEANGLPPGAIAVDNTDPGFLATGTWPTSTAVAGFLGPNYQFHAANGDEPSAIIVDNPDGVAVGTWPTSTSVSGFFGSNYQFHAAGTGTNTFTWTPVIPSSDSFNVYARWTSHPNRASDAKYTVTHAGGNTQVVVNQQMNNGVWILLGTFTMDPGQGHQVNLTDQANGFVIADAVKVVPVGASPNTATWTPTIPVAGSYKVFARWTAHPNRATDAKYTVLHDGGTTLVTIDQQQNNGTWILLGTFNLTPGLGQGVSLTDQANGFVIADAVMILDANAPDFNAATWTPNAAAGQYEVYARWTSHPNRATNATYTINHAQGTAVIIEDQQVQGGQFNLLGTFSLDGSSTIVLDDVANGFVIADAIQLIPIVPAQEMFFIHTDHLNTPRLVTNGASQAVWQWNNDDPYGDNTPNENPSGIGNFTCNLRLPGQYFDVATKTNYNVFRDYDSVTGRYIESDPMGLLGGINTYTYVGNSPVRFIDPDGLRPGDNYPTIRAAGNQSILDINPTSISEGREYGGVIYMKPGGNYSYTAPVPGGRAGVPIPFTTSPAAQGWYHTHGSNDPGYDNENYSAADRGISDRRSIPGYLGTPSGAIKEYVPVPGRPGRGIETTISNKAENKCVVQ